MCNIYDYFCTLRNNYNLSMAKRITSWQRFKNYIRTFKVGDIITRKMLLENTGAVSSNTVDSFRRCLEKNNVIVKVEEFPGTYILCHELPKDITLNELMLRGYGKKPKEVPELVWRTHKLQNVIYIHEDGVEPDPLYKTANKSIFDIL